MDDIASIITQQGEIARRRKLLEAMQGQNMQSGIVGSHRGAAIGQALAKVATADDAGKAGGGAGAGRKPAIATVSASSAKASSTII